MIKSDLESLFIANLRYCNLIVRASADSLRTGRRSIRAACNITAGNIGFRIITDYEAESFGRSVAGFGSGKVERALVGASGDRAGFHSLFLSKLR